MTPTPQAQTPHTQAQHGQAQHANVPHTQPANRAAHPHAQRAAHPHAQRRAARLPPLALAVLLLAGATAAGAQQFQVSPSAEVLAGDPLAIRLVGLPAGAEVELVAQRRVFDFFGPRPYGATARYRAAADGTLDLARDAPLPGGAYAGADPRGLFWSMTPLPAGSEAPADGSVRLLARVEGREVAAQALQIRRALPGVQRRSAAPFPGAVFALPPAAPATPAAAPPAGTAAPAAARRPALILLGGSEGGNAITFAAPAWASRGYAVLALPYYSPPGFGPSGPTPPQLPTLPAAFADIPVDRLQQARDWLAAQPEVDAGRIAVMGTSKGAEFALLAATRLPWIRAVVAVVPSDVVWEGWGPGTQPGQRSSFAWQGQALPFVPYEGFAQEMAGFATGGPVRFRRPHDAGRAAHPARVAAARIPVERIAAPVLVIGGDDDQVWDSGGMARAIAQARSAAGLPTLALVYPQAGHALGGDGWHPTTQHNAGPMTMGGNPQADAQAQAEAWVRTVQFLAGVLKP